MMPFIPLMKEFEMKEHAVKRHLVRRAFLVARASFLKNNERSKYQPLIAIDITPLTESDDIAISIYDEKTQYSSSIGLGKREMEQVETAFYLLDRFCKNEFTQELIKYGLYFSRFYDRSSIFKNENYRPGFNIFISKIKNFKKEEKGFWSKETIKEQAKLFKRFGPERCEDEIIDIVFSIDYDLFIKNYVDTGMYERIDYNETFIPGAAINDLNVNELTHMFMEYLEKDHKDIRIL